MYHCNKLNLIIVFLFFCLFFYSYALRRWLASVSSQIHDLSLLAVTQEPLIANERKPRAVARALHMTLICEVLRRIIEALYRCTYIISVAITHRLVCSDGGIVEHLVLVWCLFFRWPESNFLSSGCCGLFTYLFIYFIFSPQACCGGSVYLFHCSLS